jgi:hypothetical protein
MMGYVNMLLKPWLFQSREFVKAQLVPTFESVPLYYTIRCVDT